MNYILIATAKLKEYYTDQTQNDNLYLIVSHILFNGSAQFRDMNAFLSQKTKNAFLHAALLPLKCFEFKQVFA